jgi:capsule polysaccharide export protein KpsE/RkpR
MRGNKGFKMNERIVDLYEQASSIASEEENSTKSYKDRVMIKFAELIVRECADIANTGIDPAESHLIGNDILEHFGVEP